MVIRPNLQWSSHSPEASAVVQRPSPSVWRGSMIRTFGWQIKKANGASAKHITPLPTAGFVSGIFRHCHLQIAITTLYPAQQDQDQKDNKNQSESAGRIVSPAATVRPGRQRTDQ